MDWVRHWTHSKLSDVQHSDHEDVVSAALEVTDGHLGVPGQGGGAPDNLIKRHSVPDAKLITLFHAERHGPREFDRGHIDDVNGLDDWSRQLLPSCGHY